MDAELRETEPQATSSTASTCTHLRAEWNYYGAKRRLHRQRIVRMRQCEGEPTVAVVETNCRHCQDRSRGPWCGACIAANVAEYRHNRLWCNNCRSWTVSIEVHSP